MGSTSKHILENADCNVVIVKGEVGAMDEGDLARIEAQAARDPERQAALEAIADDEARTATLAVESRSQSIRDEHADRVRRLNNMPAAEVEDGGDDADDILIIVDH